MVRFGIVCVVAVLALSASGAIELITTEPCIIGAADLAPDSACPPTCHRCACCHQGVALFALTLLTPVLTPVADPLPPSQDPASPVPGDVLHVPKSTS